MAKITPLEFLRQVRQEVGRVTWPSRKETVVTTAMVFAMVFVAAMFFFPSTSQRLLRPWNKSL